jgi:hypothetical protein
MRPSLRNLLILVPLLLAARPLRAQVTPDCGLVLAGDTLAPDSARADVVIRASVSARELRFHSHPRATLRLRGCSGLDTLRVLERRNLPERVEPGVTYRDVYVSVEILGHLQAACLLAILTDTSRGRGVAAACAPPATSPPPRP